YSATDRCRRCRGIGTVPGGPPRPGVHAVGDGVVAQYGNRRHRVRGSHRLLGPRPRRLVPDRPRFPARTGRYRSGTGGRHDEYESGRGQRYGLIGRGPGGHLPPGFRHELRRPPRGTSRKGTLWSDRASLGMPSTRSLITLRAISVVPPPIQLTCRIRNTSPASPNSSSHTASPATSNSIVARRDSAI